MFLPYVSHHGILCFLQDVINYMMAVHVFHIIFIMECQAFSLYTHIYHIMVLIFFFFFFIFLFYFFIFLFFFGGGGGGCGLFFFSYFIYHIIFDPYTRTSFKCHKISPVWYNYAFVPWGGTNRLLLTSYISSF